MKYVENIPNSLLLKRYYEKISEHNSYLWKRDRTTEFHEKLEVIKNIENFNKDFIIAELGCGNGQFVSFLSKSGFKSIGYELDSGLVNEGKKYGANVINANIMDTTFDHTDIFLCYEIIEHLQEPRVFFQNLASLSYSHVIIITTPNINGFDNMIVPPQKDGRFLASAIFPPYHINGFSIHTLTNLLLSVGYSIKSIRTPGKLDVEIVLHDSDYFENEGFIPNSDQAKIIQKCVSSCNGSSHMEIIAKMNYKS